MLPIRILIADDNEAARGCLTDLLNDHDGWEVRAAAENGEEALAKALEIKPDLIVLDLAMPVMDGLRAARAILQVLPQVPILVYTLHGGNRWLETEALKAGVRRVIAKPHVQSLVSAMESLVANGSPELGGVATPEIMATGTIAATESNPLELQAGPGEVSAIAQARAEIAITGPPMEEPQ